MWELLPHHEKRVSVIHMTMRQSLLLICRGGI